jgi:hypothetical protein
MIDIMSQKTWIIISTSAITSNNALYFVLLEYNIGLHGKNKTMENYGYSLQLFTRINQQLFTNTLWKMDPWVHYIDSLDFTPIHYDFGALG